MNKHLIRHLGWPHELLHYITARALNVKIKAHNDHVVFEQASDWKVILIVSAPFAVGLLALVGCSLGWGFFAKSLKEHLFWSCGVWFWFWWCAACFYDLRNLWNYWRLGQWINTTEESYE